MANKKISVKGAANAAKRADDAARAKARDSFVNFAQKMGVGADNPLSTAGYGFNPITRIRTMLEWIHRGSWLGGVAVDLVADDMTRGGIDSLDELDAKDWATIESSMVELGCWAGINSNIKWGRLYGGSVGILLVEGQDPSTPLRVESIGKDQFKGILTLDRWMVDPSLNNLVSELGPHLGMPKFYKVFTDAPALRGANIHYSRIIRAEGIELPYNQRLAENLWSESVLERIYDRMVAFDSATTGAAQLVYKAHVRTYAIDQLRDIIAAGGPPLEGLIRYVEMMRRFQSVEGMTLIDSKDKMETMTATAFSGLSDALMQFGQQLSGALQIPLVRLFGQSPAGLSATGESDLRMYYDNIKKDQIKGLKVPVTTVVIAVARSKQITLPQGFGIDFRSLWQLSDKEKAEIAEITGRAVGDAEEKGLISQKTGMEELKKSSRITGIFGAIEEADINAAETTLPPAGENALPEEGALPSSSGAKPGAAKAPAGAQTKAKTKDDSAMRAVGEMKRHHDLDIAIETKKGELRRGKGWEAALAADYGYLRKTGNPDGEPVDCFVGDVYSSPDVWVIDQVFLETKQPDEFKVMLGFDSMLSAMTAYTSSYSDGRAPERIGAVRMMNMDQFKGWLANQPDQRWA